MTDPIDYLRVSYSSLNTFDSCARKFEFNKLYPRRQNDFEMFAADVGKALHAAYQDYLTHNDADSALWQLMLHYPYRLEFTQETDYRSLEACVATLEEMIESTDMSEWELMKIKKPDGTIVPAIEVPFELRFKGISLPDGRGVAFVGFIDAVMRNLISGEIRTLDIKTNRATIQDSTPKYKFDAQQVPYGIVLEHVQGNVIDSFEVLYLDCYIDVADARVSLYPFQKDSTDIQEWLMNTVFKLQSIERFMQLDYFPRTSNGCLAWNRPCYFLEVCASRDRAAVTEWLMMGDDPEQPRVIEPWIVGEIDVYGEQAA